MWATKLSLLLFVVSVITSVDVDTNVVYADIAYTYVVHTDV